MATRRRAWRSAASAARRSAGFVLALCSVLTVSDGLGRDELPLALSEASVPWERRMPVLTPRAYHKAARGRRLSGAVTGNLETLGYFASNVCIGTPGSMHQLIIDTGSSMTAVPCSTCTRCGRHKNPKYDPEKSASSRRLGCKSPPYHVRCSRCEAQQCGYSVSYTEGSQIRGSVFTDFMHFGEGAHAFTERMVVGCQTFETGLFKGQVADGIMGISATRSGGLASPTPIDRLVEEHHIENTFAFCLSDKTGTLVLGGKVRTERTHEVHWLPMRDQKFYALYLEDIQLEGKSFGVDRRRYQATIIDTGTTFLYLPPEAYRRLRTSFTATCPWGACVTRKHKTRYSDEFCYAMSEAERAQFKPLSFIFQGSPQPLVLSSSEYTYELHAKGVTLKAGQAIYCLAAFDNKHAGVVLGAAVLRNREVILDRSQRRVGFVRADCASAEPATSILWNNTFLSDRCSRHRRMLAEGTAGAPGGGGLGGKLTFHGFCDAGNCSAADDSAQADELAYADEDPARSVRQLALR